MHNNREEIAAKYANLREKYDNVIKKYVVLFVFVD
jgi:hypothetical protein